MGSQDRFPLIELRGSAGDIGLLHGRKLAERIERCYAFYRSLLHEYMDADIRLLAERFADAIIAFHAPHAEEIEAIAYGAHFEPWKIYALNARTEILRSLITQKGAALHECSSLFLRQGCLLGQTWDWSHVFEDLVVLLHIRAKGGESLLTLTEPGIIAKIGLNSQGIGVCLNILRAPAVPRGVPIHVLLRAVLEAGSAAEARERVLSAHFGTMSNMIIADTTAYGVGIEIAGSEVALYGESEPFIAHTNHYTHLPVENPRTEFESSYARLDTLSSLCGQVKEGNVSEMQTILGDRSNEKLPVCCEYEPDDLVGDAGTVTAVVIHLPSQTVYYTPGNPRRHPYRSLSLRALRGS
jgi:isopenicillin-N N-acyltransferase like protein